MIQIAAQDPAEVSAAKPAIPAVSAAEAPGFDESMDEDDEEVREF